MLNLLKLDPLSLKLFTLAIQLGSITAAAQEVGLSVAAASKRISDLELYLDVSLLVRGKKGVVPTHAGSSLHQHALQVMARIEQLVVSMRHFESGAVGQLRIAVNASALSGFLPNVLAAYSVANPGVVIDVEEVLSEEAVRAVELGMVDLAIVGENTFIGSLESVVCDEDNLVLLIPKKHPLSRKNSVSFREALAYEFIALPRSSSLSRLIGVQAELLNLPWRIRAQLRSFDAVCHMVEVGMGLALVPSKVIRSTSAENKFIIQPVLGLDVQRRLIVVMRKTQNLSQPARKFIDIACKDFKSGNLLI